MTAALDTNIISFWIKGLYEIEAGITKALLNGDVIVILPVTYYEVGYNIPQPCSIISKISLSAFPHSGANGM
jgi:hypothetical protein